MKNDPAQPAHDTAAPKRQLGLFDATCIIVGIIIGSGIYKTTPFIASNVVDENWLIFAWVLGGVIAILGAMCYAELTTTYPQEGGDFVFVSRAFGRQAGFLFAWTEYWIVRPGNVGLMAFVFASFAYGLYSPVGGASNALTVQLVYAVTSVAALTVLNVLGARTGKLTQNVLASIKVVGLAAIIVAGLFLTPVHAPEVPSAAIPASGNFRLAMILVLFTYGGWNDVANVAAEVRNPEKNLFRALILGLATVTFLYVLVNLAFVRTLGLAGTAGAQQVAAAVFEIPFGSWGAKAMNILVCISALGTMNGLLFAGSRIYYAVGSEHNLVKWLGSWSGRMDSPVRALVLEGLIAIGLITGFGWYEEGFMRLFFFCTPVYWFFAFMIAVSLMVLRWRDADRPRPHKVLLYPWIPMLFCITCAILCESSFTYALGQKRPIEAIWAVALIVAGIAITLFFDRERDA